MFAIGSGRELFDAAKAAVEVRRLGVTEMAGDLGDGHIGLLQELSGLLNTDADDFLLHGVTE